MLLLRRVSARPGQVLHAAVPKFNEALFGELVPNLGDGGIFGGAVEAQMEANAPVLCTDGLDGAQVDAVRRTAT